jgi:glycosyltransferase involved in cell wall biosynthesis
MRLAVIVTTYNRPDALRAVLAGFAAQSDREFELLVADDGSREDTGALVAAFARYWRLLGLAESDKAKVS